MRPWLRRHKLAIVSVCVGLVILINLPAILSGFD